MSQAKNTPAEFVDLLNHADYEILNVYPFTIRRKDIHHVVKVNLSGEYPRVALNGKPYLKHRLIALQFLPNPNNLPEVDHINRDRTDYHLSNLRWVSASENNINKSSHNGVSYEFIDNIPDEAIVITHYDLKKERRVFAEKEYYYYYNEETEEDIFYQRITDEVYRIMYINTAKGGRKFIVTRDINNKKTTFYIHIFKQQYGLD